MKQRENTSLKWVSIHQRPTECKHLKRWEGDYRCFSLTGTVSHWLWPKVWPGAGEAVVGISDSTRPVAPGSQPSPGRHRHTHVTSGVAVCCCGVKNVSKTMWLQTVSWLCDAPPVLEECAQAATQPQLLKILLQHQACLGHLESAGRIGNIWVYCFSPTGLEWRREHFIFPNKLTELVLVLLNAYLHTFKVSRHSLRGLMQKKKKKSYEFSF